jgi:hypothetical protein
MSGFWIRVTKSLHAPADFGKKVAGFEFQKIVVEKCHILTTDKHG